MRALVCCALLALAVPAQADPLTLTCDGTEIANFGRPEPISMGVIIDLKERTVRGFAGRSVPITDINDIKLKFFELLADNGAGGSGYVGGSLDRISGELIVALVRLKWRDEWLLKCRPAQPLFQVRHGEQRSEAK